MSTESERKNRTTSGILTTIITVLLFLLIWFWNITYTPLAELEKDDLLVEILPPSGGGGGSPSTPEPASGSQPAQSEEQTEDEEAVPTKITPKKPVPKPQEKDDLINKMNRSNTQQNESNNNTNSSNSNSNNNNTSTGQNVGSSSSIGSGADVAHSFGSRRITAPANSQDCNAAGTVVIEVELDGKGKVTRASISPLTKSSNRCLKDLSLDLARRTSFSADPNGRGASGIIQFVFRY